MKFVPVISQIKFDYETKTIIRDGVPSEVNPFDLLGLVRAIELKNAPEDEVVVISMGPWVPTVRCYYLTEPWLAPIPWPLQGLFPSRCSVSNPT